MGWGWWCGIATSCLLCWGVLCSLWVGVGYSAWWLLTVVGKVGRHCGQWWWLRKSHVVCGWCFADAWFGCHPQAIILFHLIPSSIPPGWFLEHVGGIGILFKIPLELFDQFGRALCQIWLPQNRDCHGSAKTRYYPWPLIPIIHRSDPWIYMEIRGYLWFICYIWTTLMGAAAALCKLVELINFTPSLNKNTPQWIWTRIYWNTIIYSTFPLNIGLIFIPLYMHS